MIRFSQHRDANPFFRRIIHLPPLLLAVSCTNIRGMLALSQSGMLPLSQSGMLALSQSGMLALSQSGVLVLSQSGMSALSSQYRITTLAY